MKNRSGNGESTKKSLFFRDEGELGDVLAQAKALTEKSENLITVVKEVEENTQEYATLVEEAKYKISIRERLGQSVGSFKNKLDEMVQTWRDKKKAELEEKERQIKEQWGEVEKQRAELGTALQEMEGEQKKTLAEEMDKLNQRSEEVEKQRAEVTKSLSEMKGEQEKVLAEEMDKLNQRSEEVKAEIEKLDRTKEVVEDILSKNEEEIQDNIMTEEETEFARINYFNLVTSKLDSNTFENPLTSKSYGQGDWEIKKTDGRLTAAVKEGIVSRKSAILFEIEYMRPESEEGFVYKTIGKEAINRVTRKLEEKEKDALHILTLVSPTGWTERAISRAEGVYDQNTCVYLVDLMNRAVFCNEDDKKTKQLSDWFTPVTLQEEVNQLKEKLKEEIENRTMQFRVDKVCENYNLPRRVVTATFKDLAEEGIGEIIEKEEGAKDLIFLAGGS